MGASAKSAIFPRHGMSCASGRIFPQTLAGGNPGAGRPGRVIPLSVSRPGADPALVRAVAQALADLGGLGNLGNIDLPDTAPTLEDAEHLKAIAPLYLASELEQAGVLRTAELVAGLFAGGTITQPLGATAGLIHAFWQGRRQRLSQEERQALFQQLFDPADFYPLMERLCDSLTDQLDHPARPSDVHARVAMQEAADALAGWLAPHANGMALFAAQDIVQSLSQGIQFLKDKVLQSAFGVHDLWGLAAVVGNAGAPGAGNRAADQARRRAELGRHGTTVLTWLAGAVASRYQFDPASDAGQSLLGAAQAWRMARAGMSDAYRGPTGR